MKYHAIGLICGLALCSAAFPQSTSSFEMADVHTSIKSLNPFMSGGIARNGQYSVHNATMLDLITEAYNLQPDNVLGGPTWLEMDRFDVIAKAPTRTNAETVRPFLQTLLDERFHLVTHRDTKPLPAYALTAKHPTLKKAEDSADSGCKFEVTDGNTNPVINYTCRSVTMEDFAAMLRGMPAGQQYLSDAQVVDKTSLAGKWDFAFKYNVRAIAASNGTAVISIPDALEKQLGLKLDITTLPLPVLVVDSVDRKPVPNPPGTNLAAATEFEVADLKPTPDDYQGQRFQLQPGGKIFIQGANLKLLVQQAWGLTDEMVLDAPKWMESDRYDLIAKAPTVDLGTGTAANNRPNVDVETILSMLRNLLIERFKIQSHMEPRPINAYTLLSLKPKMKAADPASRTRFKEGPAALGAKDPRNTNPALSRLVTCQNMTMAQFADQLRSIAPGYIHVPVLDATEIQGGYDFTLSFTPIGLIQNGGRGGRGGEGQPSESVLAASDPGTGMSLPDAIEKQLGLKLVQQKRPVPVLVIDHIERKPTDN